MFIGRERDLAALNRLYTSGKFEFAVIYGRRRVGKTALISEFIKDKKSIYFMGVESNEKQNLENFSKNIIEYEMCIRDRSTRLVCLVCQCCGAEQTRCSEVAGIEGG